MIDIEKKFIEVLQAQNCFKALSDSDKDLIINNQLNKVKAIESRNTYIEGKYGIGKTIMTISYLADQIYKHIEGCNVYYNSKEWLERYKANQKDTILTFEQWSKEKIESHLHSLDYYFISFYEIKSMLETLAQFNNHGTELRYEAYAMLHGDYRITDSRILIVDDFDITRKTNSSSTFYDNIMNDYFFSFLNERSRSKELITIFTSNNTYQEITKESQENWLNGKNISRLQGLFRGNNIQPKNKIDYRTLTD